MSTGPGRAFAFASERGALDLDVSAYLRTGVTDDITTALWRRFAERVTALWTR